MTSLHRFTLTSSSVTSAIKAGHVTPCP
jgi:hypothetical protein